MLNERALSRKIYIASNPLIVMLFGDLGACIDEDFRGFRSLWVYKFRGSLKEFLPSCLVFSLAPCRRGLGRGVNILPICNQNAPFETNQHLALQPTLKHHLSTGEVVAVRNMSEQQIREGAGLRCSNSWFLFNLQLQIPLLTPHPNFKVSFTLNLKFFPLPQGAREPLR